MNLRHHYDDKGNYLGFYEEDSPSKISWQKLSAIPKFMVRLPSFLFWLALGIFAVFYLLPFVCCGLALYLSIKYRTRHVHSNADPFNLIVFWTLLLIGSCYVFYGHLLPKIPPNFPLNLNP